MRALAVGDFRTTIRKMPVCGRLSGLGLLRSASAQVSNSGAMGIRIAPCANRSCNHFRIRRASRLALSRGTVTGAQSSMPRRCLSRTSRCRTPASARSRAEAVWWRRARDPWKLREPPICRRASKGERGRKQYRRAVPDLSDGGGLRVIVADRLMEPSSEEAGQLLERMGSDPLYVRLCRNQESFRARLTPKPWRCGHHAAPARWPFVDAKSERVFKAWEDAYLERIA